jgi:DNA-binding NtrC family response regulator
MLIEAGAAKVVTVASVSEARERLRGRAPGAAVLDVNLGQGTSVPVAEELVRRGIPFVFATGYGEGTELPGDFPGVPVVRKPYTGFSLVEAITRAVAAE